MPAEVLREIRAAVPNLRLLELLRPDRDGAAGDSLPAARAGELAGSAGRPALNVETRIVDRTGNEVPAGTVGEIVHRSPQLIPAITATPSRPPRLSRRLVPLAATSGRSTRVGSYVVDRKKDMIKTGGENVASREVEEAIYRARRRCPRSRCSAVRTRGGSRPLPPW